MCSVRGQGPQRLFHITNATHKEKRLFHITNATHKENEVIDKA
jgi:hypothetical protein